MNLWERQMRAFIPKVGAIGVNLLLMAPLYASDTFNTENWSLIQERTAHQLSEINSKAAANKRYRVDIDLLTQLSQNQQQLLVDLPLPNGRFVTFKLTASSIMAEELAAKYPSIKTFNGVQIDNENNTGVFDITPQGFHGVFDYDNEKVFIDPESRENNREYHSYFRKDALPLSEQALGKRQSPRKQAIHQHSSSDLGEDYQDLIMLGQTYQQKAHKGKSAELKTYKIAIATTGEYSAFHGGTKEKTLAALVTLLNRVNEVYQRDLAIKLELVANNDSIVYTDANSDPFKNTDEDIDLVGNVINQAIGENNYDIGHIVGTGGGGLAGFEVVCTSAKAEGVTGSEQPTADAFHIDYVAHEIGHQFGADHTFNGAQGACTGNREASSAYEPGSGTSIMGYAGICDEQNVQQNSDPYFHIRSLEQMSTFSNKAACGTTTKLNNQAPVIMQVKDFHIPAKTPFSLTATATDADNDTLSYSWEQYDLGPESKSKADDQTDDGKRPLFRVFSPQNTPERTFPNMANILANNTEYGETLPTTARELNFKLVVRDNQGNTSVETTKVNVVGSQQGFAIEQPGAWNATQANLTWSTGGSENAPISCPTVGVLLSTDSGKKFDTTLVETTENDGQHNFTLPSINSNSARIKLVCNNNIFFAINEKDFTINADGSTTPSLVFKGQKSLAVAEDTAITVKVSDIEFVNGVSADKLVLSAGENYQVDGLKITPKANFYGELAVSATASKGELSSSAFTIKVTVTAVNDAPVAKDDAFNVEQDSKDNALAVLANDNDVESNKLTIISVTADNGGSATIVDGQISYSPKAGFTGVETLTYQIEDDAKAASSAKVSVTVVAKTTTPTPAPAPTPAPETKKDSGGSISWWLVALMMLVRFGKSKTKTHR